MAEQANNRLPRDANTRGNETRIKVWAPASILPEPDKQPGYTYKWVRVALLNAADPSNVSSSFREGWGVVDVSEQPKMSFLAVPDGTYKNNIEIGGLILCKRPIEFKAQRDAYYQKATNQQTTAVDNHFMKENNPKMPLFNERTSKVTFGTG